MTVYHDPITPPRVTGIRVVVTESELCAAAFRVWGQRAFVSWAIRGLLANLGIEVQS